MSYVPRRRNPKKQEMQARMQARSDFMEFLDALTVVEVCHGDERVFEEWAFQPVCRYGFRVPLLDREIGFNARRRERYVGRPS